MKSSLRSAVLASALTGAILGVTSSSVRAGELILREKTFIGGGTEASADGFWAPDNFVENGALIAPQSSLSGVPEPGSATMLLAGAALLGFLRKRHSRLSRK